MSTLDPAEIADQLCAAVTLSSGEDPIGMATAYAEYVLFEMPTPWPRDVVKSYLPPQIRALIAQAAERGAEIRALALIPDAQYTPTGHTKLIHLRRPEAPFVRYAKTEYDVPAGRLFDAIEALLTGATERIAAYEQPSAHIRDVLVCTHGTRDACCAKFGYPIYQLLRGRYSDEAPNLRVWRCSHFGGHRFAATLIDLPDNRFWARVTPKSLDALVHRRGAVGDLYDLYRGWGGLATLFEQAAEREIWMREGWAWLANHTVGRVLAIDPDGALGDEPQFELNPPRWADVQIDYQTPTGQRGAYRARVELSGSVMRGGCGGEPEIVQQYRVTLLERVDPDQAINM